MISRAAIDVERPVDLSSNLSDPTLFISKLRYRSMRLRFPKIREMLKRKSRIVETDQRVLDALNKDKHRVNTMVALLEGTHPKSMGGPISKKYPHYDEQLLGEIEGKALTAKINKDKFGQVYYEDMAKKLGNAILKNLGKEHVKRNYPSEKHPFTKLEKY